MRFRFKNLLNCIKGIFQFLFLIRKLYFSKVKFKHYSQFAEDISISRLFPKRYKGFFVDVGCFHPKKYNNTYMLYRRGWRGINIDIHSIKIRAFDIARPHDINIASAVSNIEEEVVCYSGGFYSLTTSLNKTFAEKHGNYTKKKISCATLTKLIDNSSYKNRQIDFLSVDAESHDLEVLLSLDFSRYNPNLIGVETHYALFSEVSRSSLFQFLSNLGYELVGWCGLTILMANKQLQKEIANQKMLFR